MPDTGLYFAAVNIGAADPKTLANFWGEVLGSEVAQGVTDGTMTVGSTDAGARPQMVFHPAPEAERIVGGFVPTLLTERYEADAERLTGLGAKVLDQAGNPQFQLTVFADPEGNRFQLVHWQAD